jgi:hypothetical protein
MKNSKMSLKSAFEFVKARRCIIRPNIGFIKQLLVYEKELFGTNSMEWEDYIADYYYLDLEMEKSKLYDIVMGLTKSTQDPHVLNQQILQLEK